MLSRTWLIEIGASLQFLGAFIAELERLNNTCIDLGFRMVRLKFYNFMELLCNMNYV